MSDILPFEFNAHSDTGYKLAVYNQTFSSVPFGGNHTSRAWYSLWDPKGRAVKDGPIQGLFQWWPGIGFIQGYPAMAETKREEAQALKPVTPKDIMSRFSDYGEWQQD